MKKLYRALVYLVTCAVPVVIAACYGMPYRYSRGGKVLDKKTRAPVSQIIVSCGDDDGGFIRADTTGEAGEFQVEDSVPCPSVQFVDGLSLAGDAGVSDAGTFDGGTSVDGGVTVRTERYLSKTVPNPFGEDAWQVTIELDRSN